MRTLNEPDRGSGDNVGTEPRAVARDANLDFEDADQ